MEKRDMTWKTLESEYIIKRPWLTARRDKVQLPTGAVHDEYYVLEYPDWVNVIAITDDGRFVFVRQYRHGLGETSYEICAGVMEPGEAPLDAMKRELEEETGYTGGEWRLLMQLTSNASTCTNMSYCFVAEGVTQTAMQHLDDTEDIEVHLFTEQEVRQMLADGVIKQSLMAAPLWRYFAEK
ncbi:MAG: NUDIX hydrolase [Prevotella sp.]|nr:NUDIX hydrolase [Prevotella sp.]MBQ8629164.1 NUDIX hydrolase [Prevotella sp.]